MGVVVVAEVGGLYKTEGTRVRQLCALSSAPRNYVDVLAIVNRSNKTETDAQHAGTPCLIYPQHYLQGWQ